MKILCIYYGQSISDTKDHIPPLCFFPIPRPSNLITVPCCKYCNNKLGKDDERVRNIITSLSDTEKHNGIKNQLSKKRNRSLIRKEGRSNLEHLLNSIYMAEFKSVNGTILGSRPIINLDQKVMDRFIERMTRALMYNENSIGYSEGDVSWNMSISGDKFTSMPYQLRQLILSGKVKRIGDDIFTYVGYYERNKSKSLWIMNFYNGLEIMSVFRPVK